MDATTGLVFAAIVTQAGAVCVMVFKAWQITFLDKRAQAHRDEQRRWLVEDRSLLAKNVVLTEQVAHLTADVAAKVLQMGEDAKEAARVAYHVKEQISDLRQQLLDEVKRTTH